jgi:hypothetical protein
LSIDRHTVAKKEVPVIVHGLDLVCPFSGVTFGGITYARHTLVVRLCRNGMSFTAFCGHHSIRIFMQDPILAERLLEKQNGQQEAKRRSAAAE